MLISLLVGGATAFAAAPELKPGDRVALVGNTFIEREAADGYIETALMISHADAKLVFRNFGWSGDTVTGASRGYFKPEQGYGLLLKDVALEKPTVIILNYGANAAWDGEAGVAAFKSGLAKLMDDLKAKTNARFILMSPPQQEAFASPYPDPEAHNAELARYTAVIKALADERGAGYIDLYGTLKAPTGKYWTSNSVHFTPAGYQQAAAVISKAFGKQAPDLSKADGLRQAIIAKNEQFFNRWRPQNTTYLFGFRKHEQGNNGVEVDQILPYVEKLDAEIQGAAAAIAAGKATQIKPVTVPGVGFKPSEGQYVNRPDAELATLKVPEDLEVSLFAAEPMVVNPTNMNWDAKGRLWVASAPLYPHVKPGHRATDRILVLEDVDKDGKADKSTVFADGLLIPTFVLPGDGGCYVGNSTEILHFKDTDGDLKADEKVVVMSGFGTEDTHHILHTPRWGQDGLMYFNQSIYIHSHVETPWGVSRLMAGGIWQFEPLTGKMKVTGLGLVNSWGHHMDDWGQSFATDGAGGDGINYWFPGVAGVTSYGTRHIMRGMNPGQPKICGLEILSGTHLPEKYRGIMAGNDFRGHRTPTFKVTDNGSGYVSKQQSDLIGTGHSGVDRLGKGGAFRPIDIKMGPDGAIYIADWSNIIIQHGEVDFRDHRRDHEHGRIWRITAKNRPLTKAPIIVGAKESELIKNLESPERWVVDMSKRELIERGPGVLNAIKKWESGLKGDDADRLRLHAMWLHVGLDHADNDILRRCLTSKDGKVRAAAVRTVRHWQDRIPGVIDLLAAAVKDEHARVRLEALHALRDLNTTQAAELAVKVLDKEMDKYLDYTLVLTLRELQGQWAGKTTFGGNINHVSYAIKATGNNSALSSLFNAAKDGTLPAETRDDVMVLLAQLGDAKQLRLLYDQALKGELKGSLRVRVLNAIGDSAERRRVRPHGDVKGIMALMDAEDAAVSGAATQLTGKLKIGAGLGKLQEAAMKAGSHNGDTAIGAIANIGGGGAVNILTKLAAEAPGEQRRIVAVAQLVRLDRNKAAQAAIPVLSALPETANPAPLFDAFYRFKDGPGALDRALKGKAISAHAARIGVRQANTAGRNLSNHIKILSVAGKLQPMKQSLTKQEMTDLVAKVQKDGNPVIGEAIYRRKELACATCHAIGGAGSKIGPDMVSIGASAPVDYIIESLINPNAKIKEGYHMTVVELKNGQTVAGGQVSDAGNEVVIRDPAGNLHTLNKKDVRRKTINPTSMMPPGLTAGLQPDEFVHLTAFLSQLGKTGPYTVPKEQYGRNFQVAVSDAKVNEFQKKNFNFVAKNMEKVQWLPATARVNGTIPVNDGSVFGDGWKFMRFTIEASKAGPIDLKIPDQAELSAWHNGTRIKFRTNTCSVNLDKGTHTILVQVGNKYSQDFYLRLDAVKGTDTAVNFK
jgi:putative heme-binding domain-containing protein